MGHQDHVVSMDSDRQKQADLRLQDRLSRIGRRLVVISGKSRGERLTGEMSVPFLGWIPIGPRIVECGNTGTLLLSAHPESPTAQAYLALPVSLDKQKNLWGQASEKEVLTPSEALR